MEEKKREGEERKEQDSNIGTFSCRQVQLTCREQLSEVNLLQMAFFLDCESCFCSSPGSWMQRDAESGCSCGIMLGTSRETRLRCEFKWVEVLKDMNIGYCFIFRSCSFRWWKKFADGKKPGGALVKVGNATGSRTDWQSTPKWGSIWEMKSFVKERWGEGEVEREGLCYVATKLKQSASAAGGKWGILCF